MVFREAPRSRNYFLLHFAITSDTAELLGSCTERCSVITRGTRTFRDTLYSTCTRENVVMMVAFPSRSLVRERDSGTGEKKRGESLEG